MKGAQAHLVQRSLHLRLRVLGFKAFWVHIRKLQWPKVICRQGMTSDFVNNSGFLFEKKILYYLWLAKIQSGVTPCNTCCFWQREIIRNAHRNGSPGCVSQNNSLPTLSAKVNKPWFIRHHNDPVPAHPLRHKLAPSVDVESALTELEETTHDLLLVQDEVTIPKVLLSFWKWDVSSSFSVIHTRIPVFLLWRPQFCT